MAQGDYFNGNLRICKTAQPVCRSCGTVGCYEFTYRTTFSTIVSRLRQYGWSLGDNGLTCPNCKRRKIE